MKKILLLGGSYFQVPSVKKAKEMGLYTITCDYLPNNPGHKYADEYHNVSTTDKEAVLKLAKDLKIDAIVCYASDPAAPTCAYVAEKMGLPGHPYESVEILSNKDKFRKFLKDNGFNTPRAKGYTDFREAIADWNEYKKPVMIKPVDSSGSRGVRKINDINEIQSAVENALSFSRVKRFIMEEYIDIVLPQIQGEGFSVNGNLKFADFSRHFFSEKNASINPFVPISWCLPSDIDNGLCDNIRSEIQKVLLLLNMKTGAYNFESRVDKNGKIYLMEIAPRNGGNFIPQLIEYSSGFDMVKYTIKAALGEDCSSVEQTKLKGYHSYYVLYSLTDGILESIDIDDDFRKNNILELNMMKNIKDKVNGLENSGSSIGVMILQFKSMDEMFYKMENMNKYVKINVKSLEGGGEEEQSIV